MFTRNNFFIIVSVLLRAAEIVVSNYIHPKMMRHYYIRRIPVLVSLVALLSFIGWYINALTYFQCKQAAQRMMWNNNGYRGQAESTQKEDLTVATTYKLNNLKRLAEEQSIVNLASEKIKSPLPTAKEVLTDNLNNLKRLPEEQSTVNLASEKIKSTLPTAKEVLTVATTYNLNNLKRLPEQQSIVNLASEKIKSTLPKATQKVLPIETNVKSRNSENNDITKLSEKRIALEHATDPLPLSAVCTDEVFLIIAVISLPIHAYRRALIRQSYANSYSKDINLLKIPKPFPDGKNYAPENVIKTVFIISQSPDSTIMNSVLEEARLKKDIVIGGTLENYRNLTLKTKLALKWSDNCKSKFFLKTDDDTFVNPVALVEWLKVQPQNRLYTGMCTLDEHPHRDKTSKW